MKIQLCRSRYKMRDNVLPLLGKCQLSVTFGACHSVATTHRETITVRFVARDVTDREHDHLLKEFIGDALD
jgi:hypothetical protein